MIKLYNSLTSKVEPFKPIQENEVHMYVCGPTVYNDSHIGNSRPVVFFDVVARFFKYVGYQVTYVTNFTDIDDKIIQKAKETESTEEEVAQTYIDAFIYLRKQLNCLAHDCNPRVSEFMDEIIRYIDVLISKNGAYVVDGDVYFSIDAVSDYGKLSGQTVENLQSGARIQENEKKKNPIDFTLWKKTTEGRRWESPWSVGRPGWHTECAVMIDSIFKGMIDIHGGGMDLKFPHHDNEIAQSECTHNHAIANYWLHNGRIEFGGDKMSKSEGNVVWTKDILKEYPYQVFRLLLLNVPYRQPLQYSEDLMEQASIEYQKIERAYVSLFRKIELTFGASVFQKKQEILFQKDLLDEFVEYMSDDFNTPNALMTIFKVVKQINQITRKTDVPQEALLELYFLLKDMLWILGIEVELSELSLEDRSLIHEWEKARKSKDFARADSLREEMNKREIKL